MASNTTIIVTPLAPPPWKNPIYDTDGVMNVTWHRWFLDIWNRVGASSGNVIYNHPVDVSETTQNANLYPTMVNTSNGTVFVTVNPDFSVNPNTGTLYITHAVVGNTDILPYIQASFNVANSASGNTVITQGVDLFQNTQINLALSIANTAAANISTLFAIDATQNTAITNIQGVDVVQNTAISIIQGVDLAQNTLISTIQGVDTWQNTQINLALSTANTATANITTLFGIETTQNNSITAAYNQANAAFNIANLAYAEANTVYLEANAAFTQANTNAANITNLFGIETTQNTQITAAFLQANSAFSVANTANSLNVLKTNGDLLTYNGGYANVSIGSANQVLQVVSGKPAWHSVYLTQNTAPSSPTVGDVWVDSSSGIEYTWYGQQWVQFQGLALPPELKANNLTLSGNLIMPNTAGSGILVNNAAPAYGWKDLLAPIYGQGGATPAWNTFLTNINSWQFALNNDVNIFLHMPHDYAPGTDVFIHTHWAITTTSTSTVTWTYYATYAKGYSQGAFAPTSNVSVTQAASGVANEHMIAEVQLSTGGAIGGVALEPDGLILLQMKLTGNSTGSNPFAFFCDLHYQSTNMPTKNRNVNFYT